MMYEVLKSTEGEELIKGDVLRTLYLFSGILWFPELYDEYVGFVRTLGDEPAERKAVEKAVKELVKEGILKIKEGIRATASAKGEETFLVSFTKPLEARQMLSTDNRVVKYLTEWKKYVGELRK